MQNPQFSCFNIENDERFFSTSAKCDGIKMKYSDLEKEFLNMRSNNDMKTARMEARLKFLEEKTQKQSDELIKLRTANHYANKKIDELKFSNKELLMKNENNQLFVDAWQVRFPLNILPYITFIQIKLFFYMVLFISSIPI